MEDSSSKSVGPEGSPSAMWLAVLAREGRVDGYFVYGVSSTGVYCRPSCPSRRPAQRNVSFFRTSANARSAGFRACRRCEPDKVVRNQEMIALVRDACRLIDDSPDEPPTLDFLSAEFHVSKDRIQRAFKEMLGISAKQYADARRVERIKARLREGQDVTTALHDAGYGSSSRLYERAADHFGMTPASYRKGGEDAEISFTIVESDIGRVLVGMTASGICRIDTADQDSSLVKELRREFPRATLTRDDALLEDWVQVVLDRLDTDVSGDMLPLDLRGTAFQRQVWEALRQIPIGETRTYQEIAQAVGRPTAVRAVASACAANPVPVVVPCHRVVRRDGDIGGYRLGRDRKIVLLAREEARTLGMTKGA